MRTGEVSGRDLGHASSDADELRSRMADVSLTAFCHGGLGPRGHLKVDD